MTNDYIALCLAAQALRRELEGLRTPLAHALGVAASVYTHQLANVHRVLGDVRVRHLIADEVGLGKTIQALMVLNVLRLQRPGLRTLVIVPDRLVTQWRDELMVRAHCAPTGDPAGLEAELEQRQDVRLAWEGQLNTRAADGRPALAIGDISAERYELLIVDELHKLRADLQERILREGPRFEHLLLLTATPQFRDARRHAQLFRLIEPERSALVKDRLGSEQSGAEVSDAQVVQALLDRDTSAAAAAEPGDLPTAALAHCAYRRVVRTRRADYPGVLPQRRHVPLVIEPLQVERERQALMREYLQAAPTIAQGLDLARIARRAVLSPPSLELRVDELRRDNLDVRGLLAQVKPLAQKSRGDSRADALIDLLAALWTEDPHEQVVVAAQDNPTVDYLHALILARLPVIGPLEARIPLCAARLRQGGPALQDLAARDDDGNAALEAFQRGEAQVLFAAEAAQVGLNLQCARVLVLYSVPWRPEEVEQWIGRLDRIGNAAAIPADGQARTIDVYTIAHRGMVDERIVSVLERYRVFEQSVNLDGAHLEDVARGIEAAALRPAGASWGDLEVETVEMAEDDGGAELESPLRAHLPWTVEWAKELRRRVEELPPAPLALARATRDGETGPRSWDRALQGLVWALALSEYEVRSGHGPAGAQFQTLWYRFGAKLAYRGRELLSRIPFTFGADPGQARSPIHAHTFITRRKDLATPPRREVTLVIGEEQAKRPLRFLSFGDQLHDELVDGWCPATSVEPRFVLLRLAADAPLLRLTGGLPAGYVVRLATLDPADALAPRQLDEESARGGAQRASALAEAARAERCALEADRRWLRTQLTAALRVEGLRSDGPRWLQAAPEELSTLLDPLANTPEEVCTWQPLPEQRRRVEEAVARLARQDDRAAQDAWGEQLAELDRALKVRRFVTGEEARDSLALAELALANADGRLSEAQRIGTKAQVTRTAGAREKEAEQVALTRALWDRRDTWLRACADALRGLRPQTRLLAVIAVEPAEAPRSP